LVKIKDYGAKDNVKHLRHLRRSEPKAKFHRSILLRALCRRTCT